MFKNRKKLRPEAGRNHKKRNYSAEKPKLLTSASIF